MSESMDSLLTMVTKPGYVLLEPDGVDYCAGFEFSYQDERFDGCRMGQLLPVLWAQKVLSDKVAEMLADPEGRSHGIEGSFTRAGTEDEMLAEQLADMVYSALLHQMGSEERADRLVCHLRDALGLKVSFETEIAHMVEVMEEADEPAHPEPED